MMLTTMCGIVVLGGSLSMLAWAAISSWITWPVWWDWWKASADWQAVWARARRMGWWVWFAPLALGATMFTVAALLNCPGE